MAFSYMCAYNYHADCWLKDCTCGCHRQERGRTNGERTDRKAAQEEAEEAQALYEYSMPGDFVRTEKDKEDYKNYTITVIDKILKELNIKDMNDKKKLIKFIRRWRGVDTDSQYEKDVLETIFPSSKKNLDN